MSDLKGLSGISKLVDAGKGLTSVQQQAGQAYFLLRAYVFWRVLQKGRGGDTGKGRVRYETREESEGRERHLWEGKGQS